MMKLALNADYVSSDVLIMLSILRRRENNGKEISIAARK